MSGLLKRAGWLAAGVCLVACPAMAKKDKDRNGGDLWEHLEANDWPVLYKNKKGAVEQVRLLGRFDLQYGHVDSDQGDDDKFEIRRLRLGARVKFLDDWRVKVVTDMVEGSDVTYDSLNTAYLGYSPSKHLKFKLGKQTPHFGQEWSTSSMDLRVIERALLVQQVRPRRSTGLTVAGDWENWEYEFGGFSGDRDREFGGVDAGVFLTASIGYDFTDMIDGWKDFDWRLDYLYNDGHPGNGGVKPYSHSFSTSLKLRKKRFRMAAEAIYAEGIEGRPDVWGFLVTPSWELVDDTLDLVLRYHYAKSDGRDGLRLRRRYERLAPDLTDRGRGEEYQSLYLGLRYHLVEDRLTFSTGAEWSEMVDRHGDGGDFDGISWLSVLRFDF